MILAKARVEGSHFGLEMLMLSVIMRARIVQVPVNYHPRVGQSSVTGHLGKAVFLGLKMLGMVIAMRLRTGSVRRR
jgi:hypothetical protein